jgi:RND family efflux transporter MFP subunit
MTLRISNLGPVRTKRRLNLVWTRLLAVATAVILSAGCNRRSQEHTAAQPDLPTVQVRTQTVQNKPIAAVEEVVGTVCAKLRATIEAKISGRITEMPVVLAQKIRVGELLVRLNAPEIKARLEQAEASLAQAERDWKRVSALFNQQAATRADYDAADSHYLVAKGALAEAKALMGYVEILAPFDGVVTRKWVDVGDQAAPGKSLIDLEDPSKLQLEADVPEAIAGKIQQGASMAVRIDETTADLPGTVTEIAPIADPTTRTFRVKLDLPSLSDGSSTPHSALRAPHFPTSGQFARLMVPVSQTASMRVPSSAILQRGQMEIVFAIENQRARLHLVKTGRRVNDETEILSGLASGDLVVIDNPQQLVDGQPVRGSQ